MSSQSKLTHQRDETTPISGDSTEEIRDEILTRLVQSWEVNVEGIDVSERVMTVIALRLDAK